MANHQKKTRTRRSNFLLLPLLGLLAACDTAETGEKNAGEAPMSNQTGSSYTIYSPAPPQIMLHRHNLALGKILEGCGFANQVPPVALPQSINQLDSMTAAEKAFHLPIITTIDFLPAVTGSGPDWHAYSRINSDLKFVASLYDVTFGVLAFDATIQSAEDLKGKRIGAPPRPSAVRLFTEALVRDGWGMAGEIEIVDILPPDLGAALKEGRIDATSWNLVSHTGQGQEPMAPPLLGLPGAHWLPVDDKSLAAINDANPFKTARSQIKTANGNSIDLLSFKQGLAAWTSTPADQVGGMLSCMASDQSGGFDFSPNAMADWPHLTANLVHPGAVAFYQERGVTLPHEP